MSKPVTCRCGKSFNTRPEQAGQTFVCPACHQPFTVPPPSIGPIPVSALKIPLALLIGGSVLFVSLLMCGVLGGLAYYSFSNSRKVTTAPPTFGPPPGFGQPPGSMGPHTNFGPHSSMSPPTHFGPPSGQFGPYGPHGGPPTMPSRPSFNPPGPATNPNFPRPSPFPNTNSSRGDLASGVPPAGMRTHRENGLFSIDIPLAWEMKEEPQQMWGKYPMREFIASRNEKGGHLSVLMIEVPNASQQYRTRMLEDREKFLRDTFQEGNHRVVDLQGLERTSNIPDVVSYTYRFEGPRKRGNGEGKIFFTAKRITILHGMSSNQASFPQIQQSLGTYREL